MVHDLSPWAWVSAQLLGAPETLPVGETGCANGAGGFAGNQLHESAERVEEAGRKPLRSAPRAGPKHPNDRRRAEGPSVFAVSCLELCSLFVPLYGDSESAKDEVMSVLICGEDRRRLRVTGDIDTELSIPRDEVGDGRYWLTFSDSTLIEAAYEAGKDCRFAVAEEGAGIVHVDHRANGDLLRLDWRVDWVAVTQAANGARAKSVSEPIPVLSGLFGAAETAALPY
jgi:hypothetical protein